MRQSSRPAVEAGARQRENNGCRDDAERSRGNEWSETHTSEGRHQVDHEERKYRHQPQEEKVAESVVAKAFRKLVGARACQPQQRLAECRARHQKDERRANRRAHHRGRSASQRPKQKSTGDRQKGSPRH
jgi:hypothetical protein